MAKKLLTDTWLRNYNGKITEKELTKSDGDGLEARLRNGTISFIYRPVLKGGKRIKMTLGRYPAMSLSDARVKANEYRIVVSDGHDPRKTQKAKIEAAMTEPTMDDVFDYWYQQYCVKKVKDHNAIKRSYENHVKPRFGGLYCKDITRHQVVKHFMAKGKSSPSAANKAYGIMRQSIEYAANHQFYRGEIVLLGLDATSMGLGSKRGTRRLSEDEIKLVLGASDEHGGHERQKIVLRLLLFYGCRGGELIATRRDWLDFDRGTWSVPWQYHKTGQASHLPLVRPIIPEVRHLWERALELSPSSTYVFTTIERKVEMSTKPMSRSALLDIPNALQLWITKNRKDDNGNPIVMEHWSNHDLRRTARTFWSELGEWAVCEKMMGHKLPGDSDTYDGSDYLKSMIPIYKRWWTKLESIQHGEGKVVSLRA